MNKYEEREWSFQKENGWGSGPWNDEPDVIRWVDKSTGFDCMIVRNNLGALCGYVGVTKSHSYYKKFYDDVDIPVHGGLTYASLGRDIIHGDDEKINTGEFSNNKILWWFGFDCAHYGDVSPGMFNFLGYPTGDVVVNFPAMHGIESYKNIDYVKHEISNLANGLYKLRNGEIR